MAKAHMLLIEIRRVAPLTRLGRHVRAGSFVGKAQVALRPIVGEAKNRFFPVDACSRAYGSCLLTGALPHRPMTERLRVPGSSGAVPIITFAEERRVERNRSTRCVDAASKQRERPNHATTRHLRKGDRESRPGSHCSHRGLLAPSRIAPGNLAATSRCREPGERRSKQQARVPMRRLMPPLGR